MRLDMDLATRRSQGRATASDKLRGVNRRTGRGTARDIDDTFECGSSVDVDVVRGLA